jgi:hypothetical protein
MGKILIDARTAARSISGFVLGCVLFGWSFILAGAGHGSNVPLASATPLLFLVLALFNNLGLLGLLFLLAGTGLLWAIYFGAFPTIESLVIRMLLVVLVALLHLGIAFWKLTEDTLLRDSFKRFPKLTGGYFVLFGVSLLLLGALTWMGPKRRVSTPSS